MVEELDLYKLGKLTSINKAMLDAIVRYHLIKPFIDSSEKFKPLQVACELRVIEEIYDTVLTHEEYAIELNKVHKLLDNNLFDSRKSIDKDDHKLLDAVNTVVTTYKPYDTITSLAYTATEYINNIEVKTIIHDILLRRRNKLSDVKNLEKDVISFIDSIKEQLASLNNDPDKVTVIVFTLLYWVRFIPEQIPGIIAAAFVIGDIQHS